MAVKKKKQQRPNVRTVNVSPDVHKQLRVMAANSEMNLGEMVAHLVGSAFKRGTA